jgi:hypothetical protein
MLSVCGSMSTKTGFAPTNSARVGRWRRSEGRGDDLVARADAGGEHRRMQACGAGGDADRVSPAGEFGDGALELFEAWAEREVVGC